jgi:hypothetical protein
MKTAIELPNDYFFQFFDRLLFFKPGENRMETAGFYGDCCCRNYNGLKIIKKIDGKKLKPAFGWFILIMGIYIITKEIFL